MPNLSHRAQMRPSERAPPPVSNTPEAPNYSRMRQNSHIVPHSAFVSRHLPQTAEKTISSLLPACFAFLPAGRQAAQYGRRAALFRCAQYAWLAALCSRAALASALRAYARLARLCSRCAASIRRAFLLHSMLCCIQRPIFKPTNAQISELISLRIAHC